MVDKELNASAVKNLITNARQKHLTELVDAKKIIHAKYTKKFDHSMPAIFWKRMEKLLTVEIGRRMKIIRAAKVKLPF